MVCEHGSFLSLTSAFLFIFKKGHYPVMYINYTDLLTVNSPFTVICTSATAELCWFGLT